VFELTTDRLLLTPIRHANARDVERIIFEDPEVVKGLAHDGSDPGVRREHSDRWSSFGPDGNNDFWDECNIGLYVITDPAGKLASPSEFMGVTGVYLEKENEKWSGELFYALGSAFHGKGIMSEACAAVVSYFKSLPTAESLYAVYWQLLNPASGSVLNKLGFVRDGTHLLLQEYGEETAHGIRNFELWRLANSSTNKKAAITEEVATKLGHLEFEGISSKAENLKDILVAIGDKSLNKKLLQNAEKALETGRKAPGFAMMRLRL
jgi:RimJ/RimL family protein N-acetyltransferase